MYHKPPCPKVRGVSLPHPGPAGRGEGVKHPPLPRRWFLKKVQMVACAFCWLLSHVIGLIIWQLRWKIPSDLHAIISYNLYEELKSCT